MPVYTLTARIIDGSGQVRAVKRAAFRVRGEDEDEEQAERDLERAAKDLEEAAADLEAAARDENHPGFNWWVS